MTQANTNPALQRAQVALGPKQAAYGDSIYLDPKLFARVKALHDRRASLKLNGEQSMLLDSYYKRFVRAGAQLSPGDQAKLREFVAGLGLPEGEAARLSQLTPGDYVGEAAAIVSVLDED